MSNRGATLPRPLPRGRAAVALVLLAACESRPAPVDRSPAPVRAIPVAPFSSTPAPSMRHTAVSPAPIAPAPSRPQATVDPATAPIAEFHWRIDVVRDNGGFHVARALRVAGPPPRHRRGLRGLAWRFQVVDAAGAVVHQGELADPGELRGEFHRAPGQTIDAVHRKQPLPLTFSIRVPAVPASRVEFFEGAATMLGSVPFPDTP